MTSVAKPTGTYKTATIGWMKTCENDNKDGQRQKGWKTAINLTDNNTKNRKEENKKQPERWWQQLEKRQHSVNLLKRRKQINLTWRESSKRKEEKRNKKR